MSELARRLELAALHANPLPPGGHNVERAEAHSAKNRAVIVAVLRVLDKVPSAGMPQFWWLADQIEGGAPCT